MIETPVGTYNPDWALVYKNDQTLYFVAETKDTGGKDGVNLNQKGGVGKTTLSIHVANALSHFGTVLFVDAGLQGPR